MLKFLQGVKEGVKDISNKSSFCIINIAKRVEKIIINWILNRIWITIKQNIKQFLINKFIDFFCVFFLIVMTSYSYYYIFLKLKENNTNTNTNSK